MPYEIQNPGSSAPAETITDEQYAQLVASGRHIGFEITPLVPVPQPAELLSPAPAEPIPDAVPADYPGPQPQYPTIE